MFETIVLIILIVGFVLVSILSLAGMLLTRHRDRGNVDEQEIAERIIKIDQAADSALAEINKTAALVSEEINEKYQSMLFLYNLLDEKKKEIAAISDIIQKSVPATPVIPATPVKTFSSLSPQLQVPGPPPMTKKSRVGLNPKHVEIKQLADIGLKPAEIAKELNIGQGEVRLVLDLAKM